MRQRDRRNQRDARTPAVRALQAALAAHQQGNPEGAERLYKAVLKTDPRHFGALYNLGRHAVRDPIDTCLSCFSHLFAGPQPQSYDLGELGRHYRTYQKLMAHWREVLPDGVMIEVRYEDVVADLERQARLIVSRCGLAWDAACLAFHKTRRPVLTASAAQVRQPVYRDAGGRSRPYRHLLAPLLDALNGDAPGGGAEAAGSAGGEGGARAPRVFRAALSLHRQGNLTEAERLYREVREAEPDHFDALHNLGRLCLQQSRFYAAASLLQQALRQNAQSAEAHNSLGTVFRMLNRHDEAMACYRRALGIRPNYPQALANLGNEFFALNRLQEAVACLERAITLEPGLAAAHHDLGCMLHGLGRLAEVRRAFERAIALEPKTGRFYRSLGEVKRFTADDAQVAAMQVLAEQGAALPQDEQIQLQFALAKAYADTKQHDRSFQHLLRGNAMMRRQIVYDEAGTLESFVRIAAVFTSELMCSKAGSGDPSPVPVFILGMPRSGTTLVEQIVASHPRVFGGGELSAFKNAVRDTAMRLGGMAAPPPNYPEAVRLLSREQLRALGGRYITALRSGAHRAARITDKMPANFLLTGLIPLALPNARIIHMRRDPIDTCLSCFAILFAGDQPHTYDLGELGRYYRAYEGLMEHWRRIMPDGVMIEVRYEELVTDLEGQARRILAHCGLDWDAACLAFHQTRRPVWTASSAQVRQPIYPSSIGRWRPYEHLLQPLFEALGGR
ncbi:MAG: sulfotransferase [Stellaceae bacterium]